MGNPNPSYKFPKGTSGNPSGKPKSFLTKDQLTSSISRLGRMTREQLREFARDPNSPVFELMIGSIMAKAIEHGDPSRMNFILDRTIGRPQQELADQIQADLQTFDEKVNKIPREVLLEICKSDIE